MAGDPRLSGLITEGKGKVVTFPFFVPILRSIFPSAPQNSVIKHHLINHHLIKTIKSSTMIPGGHWERIENSHSPGWAKRT